MSEPYEGTPMGQIPLTVLVVGAEERVRRVAEHLEGSREGDPDPVLAELLADVRIRLWAVQARLLGIKSGSVDT